MDRPWRSTNLPSARSCRTSTSGKGSAEVAPRPAPGSPGPPGCWAPGFPEAVGGGWLAEREILPHVDEWERIGGSCPAACTRLAGAAGLLSCDSNPLTDLSRPDDPRNWAGVTRLSIPSWWQPYVLSVASLTSAAAIV